jgi:hypothetical protein
MFVRLIQMVGLRDTEIILIQAWGVPYVQFERVFYMPTGLVVGGTSLGQERESVPGLCIGVSVMQGSMIVL